MTDPDEQLFFDPPAWRDGAFLLVPRRARVADTCVRCGDPTHGILQTRIHWHHPLWYLLLLVSPLIYVIVGASVRKFADLELGLCDRHWRRYHIQTRIGWAAIIGGVVAFVAGIALVSSLAIGLAILAVIAGVIVLTTRRTVSAARMDEYRAWVRGVSPRVLASCPPAPPSAWMP